MTKYTDIPKNTWRRGGGNKAVVPLSTISSLNLKNFRNTKNKFLNFSVSTEMYKQHSNLTSLSYRLATEDNVTCENNTRLFLNPCNKNPINIFYTHSEVLLDDFSYFDKIYDVDDIYKKDDYYKQMILERVEKLKLQKSENSTTFLQKQLGNIKDLCFITLYSLEFRFVNILDSKAKPISIFLPFTLLPIFYIVDIETFKLLLMLILKFNDSYTEIIIDDNMIYTALESWDEYNTEFRTSVNFDNHNVNKFNWITGNCLYDVYIK
jgi:hypothetical protein